MSVFLIIGWVGLALLLVSLIFGEIADGLFDSIEFGVDGFSTAAVGGFIGALGFSGAICLQYVDSTVLALLCGCTVGVLVASGVVWLTKKLKSGTNHSINRNTLIGISGTVVDVIPDQGYGTVKVSVAGQVLKLNAKAPQSLPVGARVWIRDVLTSTAVLVDPVDVIEPSDVKDLEKGN